MTIDDTFRDGRLQYSITREAAKTSALSSSKLMNMNVSQVKKY